MKPTILTQSVPVELECAAASIPPSVPRYLVSSLQSRPSSIWKEGPDGTSGARPRGLLPVGVLLAVTGSGDARTARLPCPRRIHRHGLVVVAVVGSGIAAERLGR